MRLLIIDGMNLIRRMYAAMGDAPEAQALTMRAVSALGKLQQFHQPTHQVIVWDGDALSWRKKLYPNYKKGRKPMPEALSQLMPALKQHIADYGVMSYQAESEADDVIATFASKFLHHADQASQVVIVSTDKGFAQLQDPRLQQWDHFEQTWMNMQAFADKWQLESRQWLDFHALTGDSGNKVPGIAGIGPKTAQALLQQFQTLAQLYQHPEQIPDKYREKLVNGKPQARLSYQLVQLRLDLPLSISLKNFRVMKFTS